MGIFGNTCAYMLTLAYAHRIEFASSPPVPIGKILLNLESPNRTYRSLNELLRNFKSIALGCKYREKEKKDTSELHRLFNGELAYGCTKDELSKKLSKDQILSLSSSCGCIFVKKKKAYIAFYYYNQYLKNSYYYMLTRLSKKFEELTKKNGLSDEVRMKLWLEYFPSLSNDCDDMERLCEERFYVIMKRKTVLQLELEKFLISCKFSWVKCIKHNEAKYTDILNKKVASYISLQKTKQREKLRRRN
ncbi:RAD protein (Pv-fam-e) [Plasmodium ovale wallikeri]|uniref:RAD protein (Pv-fam-e) n=1 Tax=Plasmodium ovale wallikeri TaxID=864142 RepID=A0A1A9AKD5_PLAOA|nr:RAD protein (Pv-fam-e) [Plasmodium ovale wallikeri]